MQIPAQRSSSTTASAKMPSSPLPVRLRGWIRLCDGHESEMPSSKGNEAVSFNASGMAACAALRLVSGCHQHESEMPDAGNIKFIYQPHATMADDTTDTCQSASMYVHQRSGLNLTMFRAYSPTLGRWLSRDPIEERGGLNLYCYSDNDPINESDQYGLWGVAFSGSEDGPGANIGQGAPDLLFTPQGIIQNTSQAATALVNGAAGGHLIDNYDPNNNGLWISEALGGTVRDAAITIVVSKGLSAATPTLIKLPVIGKYGPLLGRGGKDAGGWLNRWNALRIGWGWNALKGRDIFRIGIGKSGPNGCHIELF